MDSVINFFIFFEILLTGYVMFHYRILVEKFGGKSIVILIMMLLWHIVDYHHLPSYMIAILDIGYILFLVFVCAIIAKDRYDKAV